MDEMLDVKQVAQLLGVNKWRVYKLRREVPHLRIGRLIRWKKSDIETFVRANTVHPTQRA